MSHSENKPKSTQTSSTSVTNFNLQDTEGVAVAGTGNSVRVTQTDYGALSAAGDFANAALDVGVEALRLGNDNLGTASQLAGRGLDTALDATRGALSFGEHVVDSNETIARDAMQGVSDVGGAALDFAGNIFDRALSAQSGLASANIGGLTQLAKQTSSSADDRVTRTAMYALMAMAAVFVLPKLVEKMK